MKKLFLSLLLMLLPMLASSQTFIKTINSTNFYQIPKDLCLLGHKYFFDRKEEAAIKIYDEKYDLVKEFNNPSFLPKYDYISKREKLDGESWIIVKDVSEERSPMNMKIIMDNLLGIAVFPKHFSAMMKSLSFMCLLM